MAKHRARFRSLHKALKDTGYQATTGPAGEYLKFLQGTNKLVVARKPDTKYLVRSNVGIIPFDIEPDSGTGAINAYQGTITVMAENIRKTFDSAIPDSLLGIERDLTKTKEVSGFYPALALVTIIPTQATKSEKTSGITKRKYKAFPSRTGGIPYGRTISTVKDPKGAAITDISKETEEDSRKAILEAIKGKTAGSFKCLGVSFQPELHPESGFFGKTRATDAPTDIPAN